MSQQRDMNAYQGGGNQRFASALKTLKQHGCTLLVVGTAPDFVFQKACQRLLGDSSQSTRRRLYVATDRDVSTACTLLSALDHQLEPTTGKLLSFTSESRHTVAQSQSPQTQVPIQYIDGGDLTDLGIGISEAVAEFENQTSDLEPAELRVCLDSLTPFVDSDRETLFKFLDVLNTRIRSVSGMGHVHLPVDRDSEVVYLLEPVFDVVVELRVKNDEPQQRWYITDHGICSGWMPQQ